MKIYKSAKKTFLKRIVVIYVAQETTQYSTYNGAEGREKYNEPGKAPNPQDHIRQYLNKSGAFDHS